MEKLEIQASEFVGDLRCRGWSHRTELRCSGWCHDVSRDKGYSETALPETKYFS